MGLYCAWRLANFQIFSDFRLTVMTRTIILVLCVGLLLGFFAIPDLAAQKNRSTGGVKGKVREEDGGRIAGVTVTARQGEREVASAVTNAKGEFALANLPAGSYNLVFRKPGLRVGTMQNVEVSGGKTRSLSDRLILPIDEGALAFVRGSVFDPAGRSVPGATIEIVRVNADGTTRRINGRFSDATGEFSFRVQPERALYRVTAKRSGAETVSKEVEVEGAMIYRVALTLQPRASRN